MFDPLTISLANVIAEGSAASQLVAPGRAMGAISVQRVSPGAVFFIRVGNTQWIPCSGTFVFRGFDPINEGSQGFFIRNDAAQAGASLDVVIGYISDRDRVALIAAQ